MIFEDREFYYFRKPAGVPSSRGSSYSFLDQLEDGSHSVIIRAQTEHNMPTDVEQYFLAHCKTGEYQKVGDISRVIDYLLHTFSKEQEYGLVNRLDTVTSGLLYFAKTQDVYHTYHDHQDDGRIIKHYLAKVRGHMQYMIDAEHEDSRVKSHDGKLHITYPLMHHKFAEDRMVAISETEHRKKGRGKSLNVRTVCTPIGYDLEENQTLVHVTLMKGARHQIRAHLAHLGYPILGEQLYARQPEAFLHLWSIGLRRY